MGALADLFDLGQLRLTSGEARSLELDVRHEPLELSAQPYGIEPNPLPVRLDVSRMTAGGYSLRVRLRASLAGPCMRCLEPASPEVAVDAREVDVPGEGEELDSPYVSEGVLDLNAWVRDALALALPAQIVCREGCAGLCPACGADLNHNPTHSHEPEPDPRWAKLRELM